MEILRFFESIRNPFLDAIFSAVTYLGDEIAFMAVAILLFWCVNKRSGYFMLISGFFGILINQTLKLACKVPRPWERAPGIAVESAIGAATGYSFPSGHSQNAVSVGGAIFLTSKKRWIKIVCVVLSVMVLISRMYLGVHTLWDVLAGAACAVMVLLLLEDIFKSDEKFHKLMPYIVAALTLLTVAFYIYATIESNSGEKNAASALKNAGTLLGCSAGLILIYPLDRYVIKFETKASWYVQIIKVVVGFGVVMAIKVLLSSPLEALLGDFGRVVRYFLMVAFAGAVWPLCFKYLAKIKIGALDRFGARVAALFVKKEDKNEKAKKSKEKKKAKK